MRFLLCSLLLALVVNGPHLISERTSAFAGLLRLLLVVVGVGADESQLREVAGGRTDLEEPIVKAVRTGL